MRRARTATPILACILGVLVIATTLTSFGYVHKKASGDASTSNPAQKTASFSTADAGDCLTWNIGENGSVTDFTKTNCAGDHRLEITSRQNLLVYPNSEFGINADFPSAQRQDQLRQELCTVPTLRYLDGSFDPQGRYSISIIFPPTPAWYQSDRTILCGLEIRDSTGNSTLTQGTARNQDQSQIADIGQCVALNQQGQPRTVDCALDHIYEVTHVVNLGNLFPRTTTFEPPSIEEQNAFLSGICTQAAQNYLGGDDALYNSTLTPFWTTRTADEWESGSRTVNCALAKENDSRFATLAGSARGAFTIDGNTPPPQPTRPPLRETPSSEAMEPAAPQ